MKKRWSLLTAIAFALLVFGCKGAVNATSGDGVEQGSAALTSEQERILGFESPTTDWSSYASLGQSGTASQGASALAVNLTGWSEINSVPISSLGSVASTATFDIQVPEAVYWGDIRMVIRIPSQGIWYQDLGGQSLAGLTPGVFHTVEVMIPSHVETALEGSYSDLQISLTLNGPALAQPYLIDNIVISDGGGVDTETGSSDPEVYTFTIQRPTGTALDSVMLSAENKMKIDDRVTLGRGYDMALPRGVFPTNLEPNLVDVASFGTDLDEFGADIIGFVNVHSVSDVAFLRSQLDILGFVKTEGTIDKQDGSVVVHGDELPGSEVTPVEHSWEVEFPPAGDAVNLAVEELKYLAPGSYGELFLNARSNLVLRSGTYYFDSFNTEPESRVWLIRADGPTYIYVKSGFVYKGPFVNGGGKEAELLVGYLGNDAMFMKAPFAGTIVAPNAKVELRRPDEGDHRCSVFAEEIQVFSDVTVEHLPFPWGGMVCPDTDEDGVSNCDELCPIDPDKTEPGICGCRLPDTDSDGDKVPDCIDMCPLDPNKIEPGDCGCAGDEAAANEGEPCNDAACPGCGVCDADGQCIVDNDCEPDDNCTYIEFKESGYWVCDNPTDWADALSKCEASAGRTLVRVDRRIEAEFLASVTADTLWIGANDRTQEGEWRWTDLDGQDGERFWDGAASGARVAYRLENWTSNEPSDDEESADCATRSADGWASQDCAASFGFICEAPAGHVRMDECYRDPSHPGTVQSDAPNCIDADVNAPTAEEVAACEASCQADGGGCDCGGSLSLPADGDTCRAPNPDFDPQPCSFEMAAPEGYQSCTVDSECPSGEVCGVYYPAQRCPGNDETCELDTDENAEFGGIRGCGPIPVYEDGRPKCAVFDDDELCKDVELCSGEEIEGGEVDPREISDVEPVIVEDGLLGQVADETPTMPFEPPCPEWTQEGDVCNVTPEEHSWCHYDVTNNGVTPREDGEGKVGQSGQNLITFNFDPNLNWDYNATPGPLGVTLFDLSASASFAASASFQLSNAVQGTVDIVDVGADVFANQCDYYTDLRAVFLGQDFISELIPESAMVAQKSDDEETLEACMDGFEQFQVAVDKTKKAMRDAQELVRQYKVNKENGVAFDNLCENLGDLPPGTLLDCDSLSNEETINSFIHYYEQTASEIDTMDDYLRETITKTDGVLRLNLGNTTFEEHQNLLRMNFMIGPLPCLMEVDAIVGYGVSGYLDFDLKGEFPKTGEKEEIASVKATVEPFAEASISLFVGAGFDACGFSASVGVEGRVNLATLSVPFHAKAGISVQAVPDTREDNPEDDMPGVGYLLPPTKYLFATDYGFGTSVVVSDIMSGDISLRLRIKFMFFSKTWRKRVLHFDGLGGFTLPLLSASTEVALPVFDSADWGFAEMPIKYMDVGAAFDDIKATPWPDGEPTGTTTFDTSRVQTLIYDKFCRDCLGIGEECVPVEERQPTHAACCPGSHCERDYNWWIVENPDGTQGVEIEELGYICTEDPGPIELPH